MSLGIAGQKFGSLLAVRATDRRIYGGNVVWEFLCDCGTVCFFSGAIVARGATKSCGCVKRERVRRLKLSHGQSGSLIHQVWGAMIQRCGNPKNKDYGLYGGRGIFVCDQWRNSFESFASDMGPRPKGGMIERRNNEGPYSPGNCYWASAIQQGRNRRDNCRLTINGEILCIADWSERTGLSQQTIRSRMVRGWPLNRLIDPVRSGGKS